MASSGTYYLSDTPNAEVRVVSGGNINIFAGTPGTLGFFGDGGAANVANVNLPSALLVDSAGNVYIADTANTRIRKVTTDGNINTIAGNGNMGLAGDGGPALAAALSRPQGLALDAAGNLYIADTDNNRIRKITTDGKIATIAGSGTAGGYAGDGGPAISALLDDPRGVSVDGAGNVYIADTFNQRIRVVLPNGTIYTIAGLGLQGYGGDGGAAIVAELNFPTGVAVSGANVYVTDSGNHAIRLLTPAPSAPTIVSGGVVYKVYGAFPTVAPGSWIESTAPIWLTLLAVGRPATLTGSTHLNFCRELRSPSAVSWRTFLTSALPR